MNILLIGSGGREHALAWKIKHSSLCNSLFIAPGNAGTSSYGNNIAIDIKDFDAIAQFVIEKDISMVIVGPEDPLVNGIADYFADNEKLKDIAVIGPKSEGAKLEGSKDFAKSFMEKHRIPTAKYRSFNKNTINEGYEYLETLTPPYVLKADGLAAGKGVIICENRNEAKNNLKDMIINQKFGNASENVVIEEFLKGKEVSVFVLTDGKNYILLPEAKDYKRIGEGDTGPNTGGMGCVSPVPFADKTFLEKVKKRIIEPTVNGLKKENIDYKGFIFFGLMNVEGDPYVIEYNVRLGDPETQVILPRIRNDIVSLFQKTWEGSLDKQKTDIDERFAATVILASEGYPGSYKKGIKITDIDKTSDSIIFHAGVKLNGDEMKTSGGRVMAVTSLSNDLEKALQLSKSNAEIINFKGKYFRKDIGNDLIK